MANQFDQFDTPGNFAEVYGGTAQRAADKIGVDKNALLGQWGLETGWGKSVIPGTNNLGNIKDIRGSGVSATDNMTGSKDKYRSFATPDDFADHYADLIGRKYPGAMGAGEDVGKFANGLIAGGYAEDPNYAAKLQAAHKTVSRTTTSAAQKIGNAITDAIMPSANAATPPNPFDQFDAPVSPAAQRDKPLTTLDKVVKGLRDPIDGGAQLLTNMLPDSIVQAGNAANNWLADKTGLVGKLPEGGVDQQVRQGEQAYQKARADNGESGIDGYRLLGNVVNPANIAAGTRLPQAASLAGRVGIGALFGAGSGALTPVGDGDANSFVGDKIKQVGMGAIAGGSVPVATGAISRLVSPNASTNTNLQMMKDEGINPTIGQTLGGAWNNMEQKLQSVPILGDAIASARGNARDQFNNAAINRATAPIGVKIQGAGQDAVKQAGDALSGTYDNALSQVQHVTLDNAFHTDMNQLMGMSQNLVPSMQNKFGKTVNDLLVSRLSPQGSLTGAAYKDIDSELGQIASRFGKSQMASESEYGDAVGQLKNLLKQQMMRSNPQVATQLQAADQGWANLVRVEQAAKAAHNNEGIFTPGQLNGAIRGADDSVRGRAVGRGTALMQDLGNAGQTVLGNKYPDSGTAGRVMGSIGALATGVLHPAIPASLIGGAAMYLPPIQKAMTAAVSSRPQIAQPVAGAIRKYATSLLPLGTQLGLEPSKK